MIIVKGKVEGGDGEYMDGSAMGEGGHSVAFLGIAGARPAVADVVAQFEPLDGGDGGIAVEVVVVGANLDDVRIHRLLTVAEAIRGIRTEFGEERRDVFRGADGEIGGAAAGVALQGTTADVYTANTL